MWMQMLPGCTTEEIQESDDDDAHELYFQVLKTKFTAKSGQMFLHFLFSIKSFTAI